MSSKARSWPLPKSWVWTTMCQVAEIIGGATPSTEDPENFASAEIPWVTPADLSGYTSKLISRGARDISKKGFASSSTRLLPTGSVLFSSRAPIGYVALAANPLTTNQNFKSFVLSKGLLPDYVFYWLIRAKPILVDYASGTTFLEISGKRAGQIPFPLAPIAEQKRIVDVVESLLPKVDAAIRALQRARENLKKYRASVLKAAVDGCLVPTEAELARKEGRDFEPASVLLERILAERRRRWEESELARMRAAGKPPKDDRWKSKYAEPIAPDTSTLPGLPEGWCWANIDQLASLVRNGYSKAPREISGVPILRISAVRPMAADLKDVRFLSPPLDRYADFLVENGDLLFTRYNGTRSLVGVCALARNINSPLVHPDKLIRVRIIQGGALPAFIELAANTGASRQHVELLIRTTAGQSGVSGRDVRRTPVPLPPLAEQERIIAQTEKLLSVADAAATGSEQSATRCGTLRQAVLKWAFEGRLVDHDPNDEPASMLLEKIRGLQASIKKPSRRLARLAMYEVEAAK